jgi:stearoyl-CoA desaturase (delta-9 desaturase)
MNTYFKSIWLPLQLITLVSFIEICLGNVHINSWLVFIVWFLIGPIGIGVGFHRLFSHRQFKTYRIIELTLAFLGTLSAYGPILYWVSEHQHHHKYADQDKDINNPNKGFWHSFLYWRFTNESLKAIDLKNRPSIEAARDTSLVWLNKHFIKIVYVYAFVTLLFGFNFFVNAFILPIFIEHFRTNLLNSVAHIKLPGSYRLFESNDKSYNNVFLGWLSFGFGWHNAHHSNPGELINSHRWWELDVEGLIARLISR